MRSAVLFEVLHGSEELELSVFCVVIQPRLGSTTLTLWLKRALYPVSPHLTSPIAFPCHAPLLTKGHSLHYSWKQSFMPARYVAPPCPACMSYTRKKLPFGWAGVQLCFKITCNIGDETLEALAYGTLNAFWKDYLKPGTSVGSVSQRGRNPWLLLQRGVLYILGAWGPFLRTGICELGRDTWPFLLSFTWAGNALALMVYVKELSGALISSHQSC